MCLRAMSFERSEDGDVTVLGTDVKRRRRKRYTGSYELSPQVSFTPEAALRCAALSRYGPTADITGQEFNVR